MMLRSSTLHLLKSFRVNTPALLRQPVGVVGRLLSSKSDVGGVKILKNEQIRVTTMRVVYKDSKTGENEWKIMTRTAALQFAKDQELDLVLGK